MTAGLRPESDEVGGPSVSLTSASDIPNLTSPTPANVTFAAAGSAISPQISAATIDAPARRPGEEAMTAQATSDPRLPQQVLDVLRPDARPRPRRWPRRRCAPPRSSARLPASGTADRPARAGRPAGS